MSELTWWRVSEIHLYNKPVLWLSWLFWAVLEMGSFRRPSVRADDMFTLVLLVRYRAEGGWRIQGCHQAIEKMHVTISTVSSKNYDFDPVLQHSDGKGDNGTA